MVSVLFLIFSMSGICFLFSSTRNHSFEEVIPISIASKVIVLFIFGVLGWLKEGIYVLLFAAVFEYAIGVMSIIGRKKCDLRNFFDIGLLIWLFSIALICWCMYGKLFDSWDEFSHWGDIVKVMATIDDYGTNALSYSWFKSYPPGMSLFQYYFQKMNALVSHEVFAEWLAYVAYQLFVVSFIIPIVCKCKELFKNSITFVCISMIVVFLGPLMFGGGIYRYLYIDPVLGVLFACGLAEILYPNINAFVHVAYIISVCTMLSLAKDVGLLFAAFLFLAFAFSTLFEHIEKTRKVLFIVFSLALTFLPKIIWKIHLNARTITPAFSAKIDFKDFFNVITRRTYSYRTEVYRCFKRLILESGPNILYHHIPMYMCILIVLCITSFVLFLQYKKKKVMWSSAVVVLSVLFLVTIVYIMGMLLSYMYKFSEYEAVCCASYERYISVIYESIWMLFLFVLLMTFAQAKAMKMVAISFLMLFILITPKENLKMTLSRKAVEASRDFRRPYLDISSEILELSDAERVFLISQGDDGYDLCVLKFTIRPKYMNNNPWSFGDKTYEDDIYTYNYSIEQMQLLWEEGNYDHVLLFRSNMNFVEKYGNLFVDPDEIEENRLYRINEQKKLELCGR